MLRRDGAHPGDLLGDLLVPQVELLQASLLLRALQARGAVSRCGLRHRRLLQKDRDSAEKEAKESDREKSGCRKKGTEEKEETYQALRRQLDLELRVRLLLPR